MTNLQKSDIVITINHEINRIGSANKLAHKCGVSSAVISQMRNEDWKLIRDAMWMKVANKLGHTFSTWQIAETTNYKMMQKYSMTLKRSAYLFLYPTLQAQAKQRV